MTVDRAAPESPRLHTAAEIDVGSAPVEDSPGRLIRQARERAQLGVEELAAQTKLTRHTLEALENDDFETLTEPVYVQGYYRKCAKVLGLSESTLIGAYRKVAHPASARSPSKLLLAGESSELIGRGRSRSRGGLWWLLLLVVVVVIVLIAWYVQRSVRESAPVVGDATSVPVPAHRSEVVVPATPIAKTPARNTAGPAVLAPIPKPDQDTAREASAAATGSSEPAAAAATGAGEETESAAGSQTSSVVSSPAGTAVSTGATPVASTAAASPDALVLVFNAASWVRIEDRTGKKLLTGLEQGGTRKVLDGTPPYSVFLGNAPGVVVQYQGKSVDWKPYLQPNSTARFSVPQS